MFKQRGLCELSEIAEKFSIVYVTVFSLFIYLMYENGSFENEALEKEDRSTKHPNLENEAP